MSSKKERRRKKNVSRLKRLFKRVKRGFSSNFNLSNFKASISDMASAYEDDWKEFVERNTNCQAYFPPEAKENFEQTGTLNMYLIPKPVYSVTLWIEEK